MSIGLPKTAQTSGQLAGGGSGRFVSIRKNPEGEIDETSSYDPFAPSYDRMAFITSKDPVYMAFDFIDNQPLSKIAGDFVKENITLPLNKVYGELVASFA